MISATTGQFSLPASIKNPLSEAPQSPNIDSEKGVPASELANRKAGAREPQNQKDSAREPLNPFANLPDRPFTPSPFPAPSPFPGPDVLRPPVPEPPLRVDPETDALLQQGASDQNGASGTSNLSIDIDFFNPDGGGLPAGNGGGVLQPQPVPREFLDSLPGRSPFNPDPRPFVPGGSTPIPFPFPDLVRPGPPVPAPPLTPPPEEDALLQTSGQNIGGLSGVPELADEILNIDADEPLLDSFGERIPFEPNGVPPGPDFFTDLLGGPSSSNQETINNARVQVAASSASGEPSGTSSNGGILNTDAINPTASNGGGNSDQDSIQFILKKFLSDLLNMFKL